MNTPKIYRAWINAPSTLQPFHWCNGVRVIAVVTPQECRVYPAELVQGQDLISFQCNTLALSEGWPPRQSQEPLDNSEVAILRAERDEWRWRAKDFERQLDRALR